VKDIKHAVNLYRDRFHVLPRNIDELSKAGLLTRIPRDPFGGKFYITREGKVESTSKSLSLGID
ncbi:MAG TPA: hypothetical protein VMT12_05540, partial [Syntrophales bacterium]|nr:hypothetical protein [Syntrophales bacterium]